MVQLHGWLPLPHCVSVGLPFVHGGKQHFSDPEGTSGTSGPHKGPFGAVAEQFGPLLHEPVTPGIPAHPLLKAPGTWQRCEGRQILHADCVAEEQPWQQQQQPQMLVQPSQLWAL